MYINFIYGIHDKNRRLQGHRIVHGKMTQPTNNLEMWRVDFIRHRIGTWTPKNWPHLFIIREVHNVKNRGVPKIRFPTCLMKIPPDREGAKRIESIQNCSNPPNHVAGCYDRVLFGILDCRNQLLISVRTCAITHILVTLISTFFIGENPIYAYINKIIYIYIPSQIYVYT